MNENVNHIVPDTWCVERLGDFVISEKGKKPKNISKVKTKTHHLPYVNIQAFEKNIVQEYTDGVGCVICEENDFLMVWDGSRSGYIGKAIKGALGSTLVKINFPGIVNDYAYYFLLSKYLQINTRAKGTGTPHVDPGLLWNYRFPIAPYNEQKRIVEKIEELFSDLDKGIEILEKAQKQLRIYRQAVLKWAFEGKLTNERNIRWGALKEIIDGVEYGSATKSQKQGRVPVLRMGNIQNGKFDWDDLVYTSDEEEIQKYLLKKDDVLFNRTNSPEWVGKTAIYKGERPAIFAGYLIRINRKKDLLDPNYLNYFLNSQVAKNHGNKVKSFGVNQSNINGTKLKAYPFPITSLTAQKKINQEIESRLSVCDKIEEMIEESLKQSEALRYSILKKAFEGRLVTQDPNDEPASILLQRIKADKEKNKPVKKEREKKPKSRTKMKEEA